MKNAVYEGNILGVAQYLAERENQFTVQVGLSETLNRLQFRNQNVCYESFLEKAVIQPISYRINVFPHEGKVRIVLPERKYGFILRYDGNTSNTFKFSFKQTELYRYSIPFADYVDKITDIDPLIDDIIKQQIREDIYQVFNPNLSETPLLEENKTWFFSTTEEPVITFGTSYAV